MSIRQIRGILLLRIILVGILILSVLRLDIDSYFDNLFTKLVVPALLVGMAVFIVVKGLDYAHMYYSERKKK